MKSAPFSRRDLVPKGKEHETWRGKPVQQCSRVDLWTSRVHDFGRKQTNCDESFRDEMWDEPGFIMKKMQYFNSLLEHLGGEEVRRTFLYRPAIL
jgi:hypothetical protein